MMLAFILTMPGRNTWNGSCSYDEGLYAVVRSYRNPKHAPEQRSYSYCWDDGWRARVTVREVDRSEAARIRRKSRGFTGYDWMIRSIEQHGSIQTSDYWAKEKATEAAQ